MKRFLIALVAILCLVPSLAKEPVDLQMMTAIRAEGLNNSQVMETASYLTDVFGPRLTGSPGILEASHWVCERLSEWGLEDCRLEPWGEFGQGWTLTSFSASMTEPYFVPLMAYPEAWTAGTNGRISGVPVLISAENAEELEKYRGQLKGKIVLLASDREAETHFEPDAQRYSDQELQELAAAPEPGRRSPWESRRAEFRRRRQLRTAMSRLFREEGAAAVFQASRGEHGTLFVGGGGSRDPKDPPAIPSVVVGIEHFLQITRLIEKGVQPKLELEVGVQFHKDDLQAYNVIAEIPGTDPELRDELVMLGGHIDSWHSGTGAADNAAGVAISMEAVRILQTLKVKPRRTVRIGFWSGEEQGLLGSHGYVAKHFGNRRTMETLPDHDKFSAYFNYDNGTGKIRGVYLQGNDAMRPIFAAWLEPFHDLGATTLTIRNTGGTDHLAFDAVGLPGFQFIQDDIDYDTRIHHTNVDVWDHLLAGDLMQSSVIMAAFVYNAAMRDEKLPRKPLPTPAVEDKDLVSLFDGKSLEGWRRHDGLPESDVGGKWEVVDGAITGDQDPPGRGGFLIHSGKYRNYILSLEVNLDYQVDSGIFLRVGEDGKSHQVTLDNRPAGDIGAIYLPWTQNMVLENPNGLRHFRTGEWNDVKIQITGEPARIRFWLNGHLVTDFQHTLESTRGVPPEGYVALQVHPGDSWKEGNKARFRNIRIKTLP